MFELLRTKWGKFLSVVFGPGSVIFTLLTIFSLILAFFFKENTLFSTLLTILGSAFAGIAGSFIKDDYNRLSTDNVLEKKGRSAIRNLNSIGQKVILIRGWIKSFVSEKNITKKELKRELEEIDRHLNTATMNISSGLEDWIDIVPELKESKEKVEKYEDVLNAYKEELLNTKKELLKVGKDEKQKTELEKRIKSLEREVNELKKEQPRIFSGGGVGTSFVVGPTPYLSAGGGGGFIGLNNKICSECGKSYSEDLLSASPFIVNRDLCPECRKNYNA